MSYNDFTKPQQPINKTKWLPQINQIQKEDNKDKEKNHPKQLLFIAIRQGSNSPNEIPMFNENNESSIRSQKIISIRPRKTTRLSKMMKLVALEIF